MHLDKKARGGSAEKREKAAQVAMTTGTKQGSGRGPGNRTRAVTVLQLEPGTEETR